MSLWGDLKIRRLGDYGLTNFLIRQKFNAKDAKGAKVAIVFSAWHHLHSLSAAKSTKAHKETRRKALCVPSCGFVDERFYVIDTNKILFSLKSIILYLFFVFATPQVFSQHPLFQSDNELPYQSL